MDIHYTAVTTREEVDQILALQGLNLAPSLSPEAIASQGFVTVRHDSEVLWRMNQRRGSTIARADAQLAGYCLVMLREFAPDIPILQPMFNLLEGLSWRGKPLSAMAWFVMGQVCVAAPFRGQGVFDGMYRHLCRHCRDEFELVVTEISSRNPRSLRAHARVGFELIHRFTDRSTGEEWHIVGRELNSVPT
ncbi:MAG TPA: GNAT family N-acetyltransferase [Phycisphaerae bacterium]|nr:GNAT family N-acetyltransferase [Phycisphaerae bacterium]